MPTKDSEVKAARLPRETWEAVQKIMEREGLTFSGTVKWMVENVGHKDIKDETYQGIEQRCRLSGLTIGRFMDYIEEMLEDGRIYIDGLTVKTRGDYDLKELVDMCHRVNVDPQEMINRLAAGLKR